MKSFTFLICCIFFVSLNSCDSATKLQEAKNQILQTDKDFSDYCKVHGINESFLTYSSDDIVLLRPKSNPVVGFEEVKKYLEKNPDKNYTLTWKPSFVEVSSSYDLAYSYGIYTFVAEMSEGKTDTSFGTYLSIWKKNDEGKWKLALDTGNDGLQ